jgi:tRNA-modifying protein YgfZ
VPAASPSCREPRVSCHRFPRHPFADTHERRGVDAAAFLQGQCTSDVVGTVERQLQGEHVLGLAAFLGSNGRTLFESLYWAEFGPQGTPRVQLEVDSSTVDRTIAFFRRHLLRQRVKLSHDSTTYVAARVADPDSCTEQLWKDCRAQTMGYRFYTPEPVSDAGLHAYHVFRLCNGVVEGVDEVGGRMPLEWNLEEMGGVVYDKGCYTGQELVARTKFGGVLRKRYLPVLFGMEEASVSPPEFRGDVEAFLDSVPGLRWRQGTPLDDVERVAHALKSAQGGGDEDRSSLSLNRWGEGGPRAGRLVKILPGTNVGLAAVRLIGPSSLAVDLVPLGVGDVPCSVLLPPFWSSIVG